MRVVVLIGADSTWQRYYKDNQTAAKAIVKLDTKPSQVYYACATYKDDTSRKAPNVHSVKAFWLDLDCGPTKPYANQDEALEALTLFKNNLGLWEPYVVKSGVGLHVYWVLEQSIEPETWLNTANLLKQVTTHARLHAGPERTADIASILRPVGTTHKKAEPLPVEIMVEGKVGPHDYFNARLASYAATNQLTVEIDDALGARPSHITGDVSEDLSARDYGPPPPVEPIVAGCAIIREFANSNGNIEEPLWRGCMGVVRLCENGEQICHDWSEGHPNYTFAETQKKIDAFKGGATTCVTLGAHRPEACDGCPLRGKIKSPISIAYAPQEVEELPDPTSPLAQPIQLPSPPQHFQFMTGEKGGIWGNIPDKSDKTGTTFKPARLCPVIFYPIAKFDRDGVMVQIMRAHLTPTEVKQFELPSSMVAEPAKLFPYLAGKEITMETGMGPHIQRYISDWVSIQRQKALATKAYDQFGWHNQDFVIGNILFSAGKPPASIILTESPAKLSNEFTPAGSLDVWKALIDRAYNHPGLQSLQFALLAGMAAPLVKMFGDYGGLVVYMHSDKTGLGKTTIERAALSTWCTWRELLITNKQATDNAVYSMLGTVSNMPVVIDELTNKANDEIGDLVHLISAGNPKKRCDIKGGLVKRDARWETIVIGSGNLLLSEKLAQHKAHAEAERARIFEYTLNLAASPIDPQEAMQLFPQLSDNYGHAGYMLAQYLVDNYWTVKQELLDNQVKLSNAWNITQAERYWSVLLASIVTMHSIALKLDLIQFPLGPMLKWQRMTLEQNRGGMAASVLNMEDTFSTMLSDLWLDMLVTQGEGDLRNGWEAYIEQHPRKAGLVGRVIVPRIGQAGQRDPSVIYLSAEKARAWCSKRGVTAKEVFKDGVSRGIVAPREARYRLGGGTRQYAGTGILACWEIDFSAATAAGVVPQVPKLTLVKPAKASP